MKARHRSAGATDSPRTTATSRSPCRTRRAPRSPSGPTAAACKRICRCSGAAKSAEGGGRPTRSEAGAPSLKSSHSPERFICGGKERWRRDRKTESGRTSRRWRAPRRRSRETCSAASSRPTRESCAAPRECSHRPWHGHRPESSGAAENSAAEPEAPDTMDTRGRQFRTHCPVAGRFVGRLPSRTVDLSKAVGRLQAPALGQFTKPRPSPVSGTGLSGTEQLRRRGFRGIHSAIENPALAHLLVMRTTA